MNTKKLINWMNPKLVVLDRRNGRGVFAREQLIRGERLAIFGGHVLPIADDELYFKSGLDLSIQVDEGYSIGACCEEEIEDTDYFNHSCEPNAGIKGQIILQAMRDILVGEEITFDYATVLCGDAHPILNTYSLTCNCGSPRCRGTITAHDWKDKELQRKYFGWFSWYLQEKIDVARK